MSDTIEVIDNGPAVPLSKLVQVSQHLKDRNVATKVLALATKVGERNAMICYNAQTPLIPTVQAVNQLIKGSQMAIHNATILTAENRQLRAGLQMRMYGRRRQRNQCLSVEEGF